MKSKTRSYSILILLILTNFISFGNVQDIWEVKADSLRIRLINKSGADKISGQLDFALYIREKNNKEALELAQLSLKEARMYKDNKLEIRSCFVLGRMMLDINEIDLSLAYYDTALHISSAINDNTYKGEILFQKGVSYYRASGVIKALETFNEALNACRLTDDFKTMGSIYSMMGTVYRTNGIYDRAIEYIIKSKLNYEKADFTEGYAWVTYLLGRIYADLKSPEKALGYFYETLSIYEKLAVIDGNNNGLAICHEQISLLELELGDYNKARASADEVLRIHTEGNSEYGISSALSIAGRIEYFNRNYVLVEELLNKSLLIKKEIGEVLGLPIIYEYLGLCLIERGHVSEGFEKLNEGLEHSIRNHQKKKQLDIYIKLADAYLSMNNLEKAIFFQNKHIELQNEILSGTASIKLEQLQSIHEIDEKNSQIMVLEKQNEINSLRIQKQRIFQILMVIGIFFIAFIALVLYFFYKKINQKNVELNALNTTKDKLFSIIAHDLKGPIGATLGLSEFLIEDIENKNKSNFDNHFQLMHQSLRETFDLLTNLLQWAHSQSKGIKFNPELLLLNNVVTNTLKPISSQAEKKNITVVVDIDEKVSVLADLNMLKTILRNLMTNAIKFTNINGNVTIYAIQSDKATKVCIKDNGIGIASEAMNKLFSLNENLSIEGTSGEKGTGLGLILCKDFVEMHKGEIRVESSLNKGSLFCFTLPLQR